MYTRIYNEQGRDITPDPAIDLPTTNVLIDGDDMALNAMLACSISGRSYNLYVEDGNRIKDAKNSIPYKKYTLKDDKSFNESVDLPYVEVTSNDNIPFNIILEAKVSNETLRETDIIVVTYDTTSEESFDIATRKATKYSKDRTFGANNVLMIGISDNVSEAYGKPALIGTGKEKIHGLSTSNYNTHDHKGNPASVLHLHSTTLIQGLRIHRSIGLQNLEQALCKKAKKIINDDNRIDKTRLIKQRYDSFVNALHANIARYANISATKLNVQTDAKDFDEILSAEMKSKEHRMNSMKAVMNCIYNNAQSDLSTADRFLKLHELVTKQMNETNEHHKTYSGGTGISTSCIGFALFSRMSGSDLGRSYERVLSLVPSYDLRVMKTLSDKLAQERQAIANANNQKQKDEKQGSAALQSGSYITPRKQ